MTSRLVVRAAAEADMVDGASWYEEHGMGLGADFLRAVEVLLAEIQRTPERFPQVYHGCRRASLRRFPYAIYFVLAGDAIQVIACLHVRRDPREWEERVGW